MKIQELQLIAFGKFHHKTITFQEGLNWIHGENESGKSTIHKFIEGMFFGFYKYSPYRRTYSEDYEKYLPLRGKDYFGAMVVETDGRTYRLERNFLKGKDGFRIYDHATGEDQTEFFPYDQGLRMPVFFDPSLMNRTMFRNTVSMEQLKVRTDEDLAKELKERIFRFSQTGSNISLTGALDALKRKRQDLGSTTRKSSALGQRKERLDQLGALHKEASKNRDQLMTWAQEKEELTLESLRLEKEQRELTLRLENMEVKKIHEKYRTYGKLQTEAEQWKEYIREQPGHFLGEEEYAKALMLHQEGTRLEKEVSQAGERMSRMRRELEEGCRSTQVEQDFKDWQETEETRRAIEPDGKGEKSSRSVLLLPVFTGAAALLFAVLGYLYQNPYLLVACGLFALAAAYGIVLLLGKFPGKKRRNGYLDQMEEIREKTDSLFKKYGVSSREELESIWEKELEAARGMKNRLAFASETYNASRDRLDSIKTEFDDMMKEWEVEDMQDLLQLYQRQKRQRRAGERIRELTATMDALMDREEFDRLHMFFKGKAGLGVAKEDAEALKSRLAEVEDSLNLRRERIHRLEGQMLALEREGMDLADLEEEMEWLDGKIQEDMRKLEALAVAEEKIQQAAGDLHREAAPRLGKFMEEYWKNITGLERDVKVDQEACIRVEDAETSAMVEADYLSMGAADQLYFAFRMAMIKTLGLDGFFLLLDEIFIQFDHKRLERALTGIWEEKKDAQVLMFTSQTREREIMEKLGVPFHPVLL